MVEFGSPFPTEEQEFNRCWSSNAGHLAGIKEAIGEAERKSAEAFVRRRDEVANALRDLAVSLYARREALARVVAAYIEEDKRRLCERTKMLRH